MRRSSANWYSDPLRADVRVQAVCRELGLQYMGYSTLGSQWQFSSQGGVNPVLTHATIRSVADRCSCSPAQVVLQWALHGGQVVIPRSRNLERIHSNLQAINCTLSAGDINLINALDGTS
eukprot:TRINITY_DN12535_c0_g1_i3.p1 TRINITY_DN12535_c0_g1~~TRINITY_DN12535_c0_g1_i3.p1  ORF type:complete len:120 (-),score=4.77 TRINITY_DN12535_c0_g1_i3:251-610(-)